MESKEAIIATMDVYVLMNLTRILDELVEMIESGKFSSIQVYTDLVGRIEDREFNEDFISEMKRIEEEKSEKFQGDEDICGD